jgi:hypothetical protein
MMMMHWNPPSLLRLLTQDVFGITHTLCTDALAKLTGRQQNDIHTATHLARGRPDRTTGAPSHTAAAHKDMERCSTCTAQRIGADKASSLAQTSLHTDRTPSLGSPSIQEHAGAHPHRFFFFFFLRVTLAFAVHERGPGVETSTYPRKTSPAFVVDDRFRTGGV